MGLLGLEGEFSMSSLFAFGVGGGVGPGLDESRDHSLGPRGAIFGRTRPIRSTNRALAIGLAYSFGGYGRPLITGDGDTVYESDLSNWRQCACPNDSAFER